MKKYLLALILSTICLSAFAQVRSFSAGPIWNNNDANIKCPAVCASHRARWNGQWRTIAWGNNSTCDCVKHRDHYVRVEVAPPVVRVKRCKIIRVSPGPIWNDEDAQIKCPQVCGYRHSSWTGQWAIVRNSQASDCECRTCWMND